MLLFLEGSEGFSPGEGREYTTRLFDPQEAEGPRGREAWTSTLSRNAPGQLWPRERHQGACSMPGDLDSKTARTIFFCPSLSEAGRRTHIVPWLAFHYSLSRMDSAITRSGGHITHEPTPARVASHGGQFGLPRVGGRRARAPPMRRRPKLVRERPLLSEASSRRWLHAVTVVGLPSGLNNQRPAEACGRNADHNVAGNRAGHGHGHGQGRARARTGTGTGRAWAGHGHGHGRERKGRALRLRQDGARPSPS